MKFNKTASVLVILWSSAALFAFGQKAPNEARSSWASEQLEPGVVVESVKAGFEAAKAGMTAGDVLLRWSRGPESGTINSPFDLALLEIEQAPRGAVTLSGRTGAQERSWTLGQDEWRATARPNFQPALLAVYDDGRKLADAGKLQQAVGMWRTASVRLQQVRATSPCSWLLFHAAEKLAEAKQWKQSDELYRQAIEQFGKESSELKAYMLEVWGWAFVPRNDWANAAQRFRDALAESRKAGGESLATAAHLMSLGRVLVSQGDLSGGQQQYNQALAIRQKAAPRSAATAEAMFRLGNVEWQTSDLAAAEERTKSALAIQQKLVPGSLAVARSLAQLAHVRADSGDLVQAEDYYRQAILIQSSLDPGSADLAASLSGLGIALTNQGNLVQADEVYRQALSIYEKSDPEGQWTGVMFSLIAQLDSARGDLVRSEQDFLRATAILQKVGPETRYYAYCLLGLGIINDENGNSAKAEEYLRQVIAILSKTAPAQLFTADALSHLGIVLAKRGDLVKAEEYYLQALAIQKNAVPWSLRTAGTFDDLSDLAIRRGDLDKAEDYSRQALGITEHIAPGTAVHAQALSALAAVLRRKKQVDESAQLYARAITALETQMAQLGGSNDTRAGFRAGYSNIYFEYADLLIGENRADEAFRVLERSRAQNLLETLAMSGADIRKGADPKLVEQERSLRAALTAKSDKRLRLLGDKGTESKVAALDKEISVLATQYQDVQGRLRSGSPAYAALTQPQTLSAKRVQEELLDSNTLLLEYRLGQERSYVIAVSRGSVTAFALPKQDEIEKAARHVYELITARGGVVTSQAQPRSAKPREEKATEYNRAADELSRMLLGPVSALLTNKRLLIVADGALHYVPFASLPDPVMRRKGNEPAANPLVVNHEIVYLPSASVLAVLRQQEMERKPAPQAVAVLADPVFDKQDPRLSPPSVPDKQPGISGQSAGRNGVRGADSAPLVPAHSPSDDLLTRSASDVGLNRDGHLLPRLLFSRQEANAIMAVVPDGKGLEAVDFDATRTTAMSPELSQYRIVHFATHGLLNSEHPELSGLVFSLVDKDGKPQNGFLQLQDIYNLNLPADLVVLSACETGLGKEISGEGLVGLTRGFMYAGASRVVASLWNVSDVATAKFMTAFYTAMEKDGLPPAAALRAAQIHMWQQKRWRSPYYWAAFQIQGEWR